MNGDRVADVLHREYRAAGKHREQFMLLPEWPAGTYVVLLATRDGVRTVKWIKQR